MFASALAFNPRSKATNIGYLLSLGAVFWLEMELLFHVGVIWRIARRLWLFKKLSHKSSILILLFYYVKIIFFLMDFCVNSLKFSFSDSFILLSSPTNLSTNLLGQPRNRSVRIQSSIFVVWELRDYNKMLEKAGIKVIDFDDFVFCTTESKSITLIPTFS